jgi:16S rRNA (cytosine967-C5)-methyltransferase
MGEEGPRAVALAALRFLWDWPLERIAKAAGDEPHGPGPLTEDEQQALTHPRDLAEAPDPVRGDYPDWLDASLARAFGEKRVYQAAALAERAPVDLRFNRLKTDRPRAFKALSPLGAHPLALLETAMRIPAPDPTTRAGAVETIPQFAKGWFEVQDLGSQIAAAAAGEVRGKQVLDLCAGGGGKTLALAAEMGNTGQIYAYDADPRRLSDTVRRSERAGVRNLQVRSPLQGEALKDLEGRMDVVFVDAPCTGAGSWRRHPDTKWRLTPEALQRRMADQDAVLDQAAGYVKPGGRIVYVTCSVLPEEDEDRVAAFLARTPGFEVAPAPGPDENRTPEGYLRLTPLSSASDGFFVAVLARRDDPKPKDR